MSRLSDLIDELCPEGVEYKKLGDCCVILDNKRKPVTKSKRRLGEYPYYGANGIQDYVSDYIFDGTYVLVGEDGSVLTKNGNPVVNWATGKIWVNNHAHIISEKKGFSLRYLFHYLQTINIKPLIHGNIPKLTGGDFKNLEIPIPPLPVQEEIVRILDTFTALITELEAELEARKQQYEYYLNKLLTFDNSNEGKGENQVVWTTINELCELRNGYTPSKAVNEYWEDGTVPWFRMEDIRNNGRILYDSIQHINPIAVKEGKFFRANTFILATSATIGEHALLMIESLANQRFTNIAIREDYLQKVDIKYFYYYMFIIDEWCKNNTNVSGFASVDMSKFKKLSIPIPPLEKQKQIVNVLDKFDELITDPTHGIPAEIEARRQQYEYYRDKLLTFKRKEMVEA